MCQFIKWSFSKTCETIEFHKQGFIVATVLWLVANTIYFFRNGEEKMRENITDWFFTVFIPLALVALFIFIWHCIRAPLAVENDKLKKQLGDYSADSLYLDILVCVKRFRSTLLSADVFTMEKAITQTTEDWNYLNKMLYQAKRPEIKEGIRLILQVTHGLFIDSQEAYMKAMRFTNSQKAELLTDSEVLINHLEKLHDNP